MRIISLLYFTVSIGAFSVSNAQTTKTNWNVNPFDQKAFIENKGQLSSDILFSASSEGVQLYFSARGLTYRHDEVIQTGEAGEREDEKEKIITTVPHFVHMNWVGADADTKIISEEAVPDYFMYRSPDNASGKNGIKASGYKKIIYKNIYPNIDIEYTFPKDSSARPDDLVGRGIKYSILLHPGANPADIKMKYATATGGHPQDEKSETLFLDTNGNIVIKSSLGDFMDHAPKTFYKDSGKPIPTSFSINNNIVSFSLASPLLSEAIIDPWVVNPGFTTDNKAFDIAKDGLGNVYVYGGGGGASVWKLKKFDPSGNPLWTYNTAYISTNNGYYGDLAVDAAGNSYIVEGCCGGGVQKIDATGAVVWNVNYGVYEFWCLAFNCTFTDLYVGCGYGAPPVTPQNSIANINLNTGAISGGTVLPSGASEPRAIGWGPNGNIYFLSCNPGNMIFGVTPAFATIFSVASGYTLTYNGPSYANGPIPTSAQNGIAANNKFIYSSDGLVLNKRNVLNGALIATVNIPGGVSEGNSGVLVDDCGNVYAGSSNGVYKYDSLLTFISSAATTGAVYCLYPGSGGEVLVSGNGFIASLNLSYCTINLNLNLTSTNANCSGPNSGSASVAPSGGSAPYSFSWNPSGQTTQTATGLSAGNYTVIVTDASGCKQSSATFTITSVSTLSVTTTTTPACGSNNGSANANPIGGSSPYTYSWSPSGGTNTTASGLSSGNYTVIVTDAGGCSGTNTVTVTSGSITATAGPNSTICTGQTATLSSSGGTNYSWSNGNTNSSIIISPTANTTYSVIVSSGNCSDTATTMVIVNSLPVISVSGNTTICIGDVSTLTASGAINYSWSNGATTSAIIVNPSSSASYTVVGTNSSGCSSTTTVSVSVSPPPIAAATSATICSGQNATLTALGGGNYSWSNGNTNSSIVISPTTTSTYSVIVSAGTCADTANAAVMVTATPTASAWGNTTITAGNSTTLNASGSGTYSWSNGETGSVIAVSPMITTGYCVTVNNGNCTDTACVTVFVEQTDCSHAGELYLPNAFSPNGDGENDVLQIYFGNMNCIKTFKLSIYDRWGQKVFETTDPNFQWDGTYKDKFLNTQVLTYYLNAQFTDQTLLEKKGNISIVR